MNANVQELFEEYNSMLPDQQECAELLKKTGIDGYTLYMDALKKTQALFKTEEAMDMYDTRNRFATTFNSFVIGLAEKRYPEWVKVTPDKRVNRVYLEPISGWRFYLKQLYGKQGRPSNIDTNYFEKMSAQELFDEQKEDSIKVVYIGAIMNEKEKYEIGRVRASFINSKNSAIEWSLDLRDYVQSSTATLSNKSDDDHSLVKGKGTAEQKGGTATGTDS